MQQAALGIDVDAKVAQKIEAQQSRQSRVGYRVMNGCGQVFDLHAADGDRIQAG